MRDSKAKKERISQTDLPLIPDKLYFSIGEVSKLCALKPHVLRYWEQEFHQLTPSKRRGNRRYYKSKDVILIRQIRNLLYNKGFTIEGARTQLNSTTICENKSERIKQFLQTTIRDLETVLKELDTTSSI